MFGALPDKALPFYGPLRYQHKQLSGELKILQWAHFVPSYDQWLDNTYVKQWGEKNDVEVKIDHINNALLFSTASSEVAAQSGHDLFQFISPPSSFQKQVLPLNDIVQEVTKKLGPMSRVGQRSTYNPKTKQFFGFPDNYAPDPVQYRRSLLAEAGVSLRTWEDVRKGAPKLKQAGHPVGLGMSNEIDSNMFLISLLYCHGGFLQDEDNRIVFNQGSNRKGAIEALELMRDIYKNGMSDEVFAWTAASNNQAFLAGRLSHVAQRDLDRPLGRELRQHRPLRRHVACRHPARPRDATGERARDGRLRDLEVRQEQGGRQEVPGRPAARLPDHFVRSKYYNFPAWTGAIKGGFKTIRAMTKQDAHKPRGKYTILTTIAEKYTTNVGHPGNSNAVIDEIFNRYLIPQMFAQVAQGKAAPADAVRDFDAGGAEHLSQVAGPGARVAAAPSGSRTRVVEVLQELMGGEFDFLVSPFCGPVLTRDQAHPVDAPEVPVDEAVPRLGVVARTAGEAQMPCGVVIPRMRLQEGVLVFGTGLNVPPGALENVLVRVDEPFRVCHGMFIDRVGGHAFILPNPVCRLRSRSPGRQMMLVMKVLVHRSQEIPGRQACNRPAPCLRDRRRGLRAKRRRRRSGRLCPTPDG